MIKTMDVDTLNAGLALDEMVLIDVREPDEHAIAHIKAATLIPLSTFTPQALPSYEGKKLVIHCRSGKRSYAACEQVAVQFKNVDVYNLEGGILAWIDAKYPVETSS